jgi:hypothetical protein
MKLLKISFILAFVSSMCSFAYYSAHEDGQVRLYKKFLSEFKQVDIPSTIALKAYIVTDKSNPKKEVVFGKGKRLTNDYVSFIPGIDRGMMSRMGPSTYRAEAALATSGKYSAVIYSKALPFDGGAKSYILATFDDKGKNIGTERLGFSTEKEIIELSVNKKMELIATRVSLTDEDYDGERETKLFITPKGEILAYYGNEDEIETEPIEIQAKLKHS